MVSSSEPETAPVEESFDDSEAVKVPLGEPDSPLDDKPWKKKTVDGIPQNESFGHMLLLLSALGYCLLGLCIRTATGYHGFPVASFLVIRGVMQSTLSFVWIVTLTDFKETFNLSRRLVGLLFLHAVGTGASLVLGFYGLSMIPFAIANSLFFLNPIFTMIFSSFLLREPFGLFELGAAIFSFIGVVLVSNPHLKFSFAAAHTSSYATGCIFSMVGSFTFALTCILVRAASAQAHFMVFVLAMGIGVLVSGTFLGGISPAAMTADPKALGIVVVGCMGGLFGTSCLHKGLGFCRAGTGTLLRSIDVPLAYVLGVAVLGEIPHFVSVIGSAIIVLSISVVGLQGVFRKDAEEVEGVEA